jgi:hypothetical protein
MKLFSKFAIHCALIATSLLLAGCEKSDIRYSETLDRNDLMVLPFPGWTPTGDAKVQSVDLSATEDVIPEVGVRTPAEITPLYVVRLDDTHAALVTQVLPVDENNRPYDGHASSGMIGAYFFEQSAAGWRMVTRQDSVATSGVEGNIGRTRIVKLEEGHFAVTAEWGSCWQGYCGRWLVVVGLQGDLATLLNPGIALSVDNDGAHGACSALDHSASAKEDAKDGSGECLDIQSEWKFQGNHLQVLYNGRLSQLGTNGELLPTKKIRERTIYVATPGQLTLISGSVPIPEF